MENILDRIAAETDLTKSERKVAATILKNPALVVNENIAQLAKRAQVSEPSICRFCKRFGAEGFPAFKLILSATVSAENLKKVEEYYNDRDALFYYIVRLFGVYNEKQPVSDVNLILMNRYHNQGMPMKGQLMALKYYYEITHHKVKKEYPFYNHTYRTQKK